MIDNETKAFIEEALFYMPDFEHMWSEIQEMYKRLGFTDVIPDDERIREYRWITTQLRRYISAKEPEVLQGDSILEMVQIVDGLIGKADEFGNNRMGVVYTFLRDNWLYQLRNGLSQMYLDQKEIEQEDDDE